MPSIAKNVPEVIREEKQSVCSDEESEIFSESESESSDSDDEMDAQLILNGKFDRQMLENIQVKMKLNKAPVPSKENPMPSSSLEAS